MKFLKNSVVGLVAIFIALAFLNKGGIKQKEQAWTKNGNEWSYVGTKSDEKKQIHIIETSTINDKEIFNTVIKMPFVTLEGADQSHGKNWRKN
jgi:hypothetical protein